MSFHIVCVCGGVVFLGGGGGGGGGGGSDSVQTYVLLVLRDQTLFLLALHNRPAKGNVLHNSESGGRCVAT